MSIIARPPAPVQIVAPLSFRKSAPARLRWLALLASLAVMVNGSLAGPARPALTYQGRLNVGTNAANGTYILRFGLYDALDGGSLVADLQTNAEVNVVNGLFAVVLDFGATPFDGDDRWLEIGVHTNGDSSFSALSPRQPLLPAPYAVLAGGLKSNVDQTFSGTAKFSPGSGPPFTVANSTKVPHLNADLLDDLDSTAFWQVRGNCNSSAGMNFLGTTDNQPLEFKVNGIRALRLEPTATAPNFIAGSSNNCILPGCLGGAIGGGQSNFIASSFGLIGGGSANLIDTHADNATIAGGRLNQVLQSGEASQPANASIGGGYDNQVYVRHSVIGGGSSNRVGQANSGWEETGHTISGGTHNRIGYEISCSTVGGGRDNFIDQSESVICGGSENTIDWFGTGFGDSIGGGSGNYISTTYPRGYTAIGGGRLNQATGGYAVIGGGQSNSVTGTYGCVPGGQANVSSGDYAFAAGCNAQAINGGSFVWSDGTGAATTSFTDNQFLARASGGVVFLTSTAASPAGYSGGSAGVALLPNATAWSTISDRNAKKNFKPVDGETVLSKLASIPMQQWNYKWEADDATPHLGPMAQDFKAAFYPGRDDKSISTLEFDGVELAAIQGLNQKLEQTLSAKISEIENLKQRLSALERVVQALAEKK